MILTVPGERILRIDDVSPAAKQRRLLRVFTRDPQLPKVDGPIGVLAIPHETLQNGIGRRLQLSRLDEGAWPSRLKRVRPPHKPFPDLNTPAALVDGGLEPSSSDPGFAQQMSYAVASWTIARVAKALGREPEFSFEGRLQINVDLPEANAYYDPEGRRLAFGYFPSPTDAVGRLQTGTQVSTALSFDVIVHETAHALLDGIRSHMLVPTNVDVLAIHEGFADLVALFSHFAFPDQVRRCIEHDPSDLADKLLSELAREFGQAVQGNASALRRAVIDDEDPESLNKSRFRYDHGTEPHARGSILSTAVFEAFRIVYRRKTERLRSLRGNGPPGAALIDLLAKAATDLADQFLDICIRAIDYLPPVDVTFGEYLRAMVTADHDLVRDDPWGYREALILAFRRYSIPVDDVLTLDENELLWDRAELLSLPVVALHRLSRIGWLNEGANWAPINFATAIPTHDWRIAQADHVAQFLEALRDAGEPELEKLGLALPSEEFGPIRIESVRALRRRATQSALALGYVVELVQTRFAHGFGEFLGGCTLIIDERGQLEYVIRKSVKSSLRIEQQRWYFAGVGVEHAPLMQDPRNPKLRAALLRRLHARPCGC